VNLAQSAQSIRASLTNELTRPFWKIALLIINSVILYEIINKMVTTQAGTYSDFPIVIFGLLLFVVFYRLGGTYIRDFYTNLLCPSWRIMLIVAGSWIFYDAVNAVAPGQGAIPVWRGVQSVIFSVIGFAMYYAASRPTRPTYLVVMWNALPEIFRWRGWRGIFIMMMVALVIHSTSWQIKDALRGNYHTDAISFVHTDAEVLLQGNNPFTADDAFWTSAQRWPQAYATPLYGGAAFGKDPFKYPSAQWMADVLQLQATFEFTRDNSYDTQTIHNYPAGVILMALPFVWAGVPSLILLNLILFLAMIALIIARTPNPERPAMLLALVLCPSYILYGLFVNIDIEALIFVLIAWHWFDRQRVSAVSMGFACAVKQLAWFILPFYLLEVVRREGYKAALRRLPWMALAFLVPNLPFIVASPMAWFHSMLIPMSDPMFPLGFGPISLALAGIIPFGSEHIWTLMVLAVAGLLFIYQWKRKAVTSDGLLLAFVPLWFSWRSPMNYFALIPFFIAWIVAGYLQQQAKAPLPEHVEQMPVILSTSDRLLIATELGAIDQEPERELASGVR
jgi:hypothetical protein